MRNTYEEFLTWPSQAVDEKMSIEDLTKMMIKSKASAFEVNGPNNHIQGIITTEDLLKYLLELIQTKNQISKH